MHKMVSGIRFAAASAALMLTVSSLPASAAQVMTFSVEAERRYFTAAELSDADVRIPGGVYIRNYTGITEMKLTLKSDAPVQIINGDFTRDPSRTEAGGAAKQCFFVKHGDAYYTNTDTSGNPVNICLWTGPGSPFPSAGVIENPDSSFLSFDVLLPKGTPAGVYRCRISDEIQTTSAGLKLRDSFVFNGSATPEYALEPLEIVVEPEPLKGDANCDGAVDSDDAVCVLKYFSLKNMDFTEEEAAAAAFSTPFIHTAMQAANPDENTVTDTDDAVLILKYATQLSIGIDPNWDDLIPKH